jgi:O-antigen ligase
VNLSPAIGTRLLQFGFLLLALFIPFSIAGANFGLGFATLGWLLWLASTRRLPARPDATAWAALLLVIAAVPSVLMSENGARAFRDWWSYWELLIMFLVGAHIARVGVREKAVAVLAASSAIACAVAFVQRAGGLHIGPLHIGAEHRVGGTLFTMTFAGILYLLVSFNAALAVSGAARRFRAWLTLAVVLQFAALLLTMTRGAWIAVLVGLAAAALLLRSRALAIAGAAAFAALLAFSTLYGRDQGRTIAVQEFATSEADRNVSTRLVLWDMSWQMFREHPFLGVGMGDYSIEAERLLAQRQVRTTVDAHNVFLQVLATRGLVGFIPFAGFFAVLIASLWKSMRRAARGSLARHYAAGALAATLALLAGSLTENNIDDSEVFIAFMFLVGIARSARGEDGAVH